MGLAEPVSGGLEGAERWGKLTVTISFEEWAPKYFGTNLVVGLLLTRCVIVWKGRD